MENINQEYFAMIASVCYPYNDNIFKDPKNHLWHFLAGTDSEEVVEDKMKGYGLEDGEITALKQAIRGNYNYSQFLNRSELQKGIENDYQEYFAESNKSEEEQEQFIQDETDKNMKYLGKADIGHMSVTLSTILKPDESLYELVGDGSGVFNGVFDLNANAGYVGDIYGTAGNGPKLTPDDYKSDLDSVNLAERLKNGGNAIIIMNQYYGGIADGTVNRAEEFATNLGNGSFEDGIQFLREQQENHESYNAAQTAAETLKVVESIMYFPIGFVLKPKMSPEYFELMEERRKIPENFIDSVNDKQNEYIENEPVNIKFAETGER